jgi:PAS domain S-box-containing protein
MNVAQGRSFDALFEASGQPAFIMDPHRDQILAANRAGCAMLGYTHAEMLTTSVSKIHPAERGQLQDFVDGVLRIGHGSTIKFTCRTKSGTFLPTDIALTAVAAGGRTYVLGLVHDRSEHRQRDPIG